MQGATNMAPKAMAAMGQQCDVLALHRAWRHLARREHHHSSLLPTEGDQGGWCKDFSVISEGKGTLIKQAQGVSYGRASRPQHC